MIASEVSGSEVRLPRSSWFFFLWISVCAGLSLAVIIASLWFWGAKEVRGDGGEVAFLTVAGMAWLFIANALFPWLGLSLRDDAWERKNPAASISLGCALIAMAFTFAAGNLGEGPSYSENFFSAGVSTGALFLLWATFEICGHVSVSIAEERDVASGFRFGGLLLAWGLILGRAVTGNWHSCAETVFDFIKEGWPAVILWMMALVIELLLKPSRVCPFPHRLGCGVVPATFYVAVATAWLWHLRRWEGMPR